MNNAYPSQIGDVIVNPRGAADIRLSCGIACRIVAGRQNPFLDVFPDVLEETAQSMLVRLTAKNISRETLSVDALLPMYVSAADGGFLQLGGGIQNWTQLAGGRGRGVLDLCDPCFEHRMTDYRAENYAVYGNRKTGKYVLFGFTSFLKQNASIRLHSESSGFMFTCLEALCNVGGKTLVPGETVCSETLFVCIGNDPQALLLSYVKRLETQMKAPITFKDVIGWATWDCYQDDISEEKILENVSFFERHRRSLPIEYIQVDFGVSLRDGDWLETNERFPHGLKWLARRIIDAGFKPGLWLCPFLAAPESRVIKEHPEWALRGADGQPVNMYGYSNPFVYGLDGSQKAVQEYLRDLAHQLTYDYEFAYLKLDGANGQVLTELVSPADKSFSNGEALEAGMQAFKSGVRPGTFLLSAFASGISIGLVDAMRVGEDVGARWDNSRIAKHHGERDCFNGSGEVLRSIAASCNHFMLHKKLWVNDPDYLVVRQDGCNSELTLEEARSWATVVAMNNGLIMLSDPMEQLAEERIELLEKVLPHSPHAAHPVDFFKKNVPSILAMPAENGSEEWLVVSVVNTDKPERTRNYVLDFAELGLEKDDDYLVFEFWRSQFCGVARNSYVVADLPPRHCRVFAVRKRRQGIQFLGTDSHISMGAVEIEIMDGLQIAARPRCKDWRAFFYVPNGCDVPEGLQYFTDNVYFRLMSGLGDK